jgi:hypothetical protein
MVSIVEGGTPKDGIPTVYRINEDVLRSYCPETSAQEQTSSKSSSKREFKDTVHEVRTTTSKPTPALSLLSKPTPKAGQGIGQESLTQGTMQRSWTEDDFNKYPSYAEYERAIRRHEGRS